MMSGDVAILVVDGNPGDVVLLERAFSKAGISARLPSVSWGHDALSYLEGQKPYDDREKFPFPSLMLLDARLPAMDGFEVLEWVRRQPEFTALPVVMWGLLDYEEDVKRAYRSGANAYLTKPEDPARFQEIVEKIVVFWLRVVTLPKLDAGKSARVQD